MSDDSSDADKLSGRHPLVRHGVAESNLQSHHLSSSFKITDVSGKFLDILFHMGDPI